MNLAGVPTEFRAQVSDDGRQVSLKGMQLVSVPEWLGLIRKDAAPAVAARSPFSSRLAHHPADPAPTVLAPIDSDGRPHHS